MARPQVPDSTVLIERIRRGLSLRRFAQEIEDGRAHACTVVLSELYAGTRSHQEARDLDLVHETARRVGHVLTPTDAEWILAGRLVNRYSRLRGVIEPWDHLADVLIVLAAARIHGDVVSANRRHMELWVAMARRSGLDVGLAG